MMTNALKRGMNNYISNYHKIQCGELEGLCVAGDFEINKSGIK